MLATEASQKVSPPLPRALPAHSGPITPELFRAWMNEIKTKRAKGKDLFHPVRDRAHRIALRTGIDRFIPIVEEGSRLDLPVHV